MLLINPHFRSFSKYNGTNFLEIFKSDDLFDLGFAIDFDSSLRISGG